MVSVAEAPRRTSLGERWVQRQVNGSSRKLLNNLTSTLNSLHEEAMGGSSMAFGSASATILDREDPVPGTNIYGLEVEYAISMEDIHDYGQINITTWETRGKKLELFFENTDGGRFELAKIAQNRSQANLSLAEQKTVLRDVIRAVKFAKSQLIIET
ncbi:MAG TPA: hypothetical protein VJ242_03395 [Patescibacteria group bacterium]|nr:hypothetical protein [Patescibacteria group bacterium]